MQRTTAPGNSSNLFTNGNPGLGIPATEIEQTFLNSVQEELCNAITADGTALNVAVSTQLQAILASIITTATPGGRLTLTTGTPVTPGDVSGATTVYYTPHKNARIALYDGAKWVNTPFAELSQTTSDTTKSPAAVANNSNYDVYVWNDAGTIRATRGYAWTSDTALGSGAGTAQRALQDGILVNAVAITNGPGAGKGRYVGTIRSDGSAAINDTAAKRHVWNKNNQVERAMFVADPAASWSYSSATRRQANANAANQLDMVRGLDEGIVNARVMAAASSSSASDEVEASIGLDSTTTPATACLYEFVDINTVNLAHVASALYSGAPGLGRHVLTWLETAPIHSGTVTWLGTGGVRGKSGISGSCLA